MGLARGASLAFLEPSSTPFPPMAEWGLRAPAEHGLQPKGASRTADVSPLRAGEGLGRGIGGLRIITVNCSWNRPCRLPRKAVSTNHRDNELQLAGLFRCHLSWGAPSAPLHTGRPPHTCWPQRGPGRDVAW